jgi:hypothetical protein
MRVAAAERILAACDETGGRDNRNAALRQRRARHPRPRFKFRAFDLGQAFGLVARQVGQSRH